MNSSWGGSHSNRRVPKSKTTSDIGIIHVGKRNWKLKRHRKRQIWSKLLPSKIRPKIGLIAGSLSADPVQTGVSMPIRMVIAMSARPVLSALKGVIRLKKVPDDCHVSEMRGHFRCRLA